MMIMMSMIKELAYMVGAALLSGLFLVLIIIGIFLD